MLTIQRSPVCIDKLFGEISDIFRDKLDDQNNRLVISLDNSLPLCLKLDEARVRQILLNLVGNAVKFTENGQICLSAKHENMTDKKIDLSIFVFRYGVGDTGKGSPQNFEAFRQRHSSSTKKHSGTGLGLSICKRLVQAMDGQLTLTSTENIGSTFKIWLKDVEITPIEEIPQRQFHLDINQTIFESKKILIVDDVVSNRIFSKQCLKTSTSP